MKHRNHCADYGQSGFSMQVRVVHCPSSTWFRTEQWSISIGNRPLLSPYWNRALQCIHSKPNETKLLLRNQGPVWCNPNSKTQNPPMSFGFMALLWMLWLYNQLGKSIYNQLPDHVTNYLSQHLFWTIYRTKPHKPFIINVKNEILLRCPAICIG